VTDPELIQMRRNAGSTKCVNTLIVGLGKNELERIVS
jgi:hypothetical protein